MRIPREVKVGAYTWKVVYKKVIIFEGGECDGLCDSDNFIIYLSKTRCKNRQNLEETFLHECLHAIEKSINLDIGEDAVTRVATGLYAFLKDNKYI